MRPRYVLLSLFVPLLLAVSLPAQQTAAPAPSPSAATAPQRDSKAIAVLQTAIAAMGGATAVGQLQNVIAQGSMVSAPSASDPAGNFTMEDLFTAQGHEFRDSFRSASLNQDFVSGHGTPGMLSNGRTKNFMPHMANSRLAVHLPMIVLAQFLANANCNITFVGQTTINGQAAVQVHFHVDMDIVRQTLSIQDWYFDPVTALPLRVEYRLPDASNALFFVNAAADLSDFRKVQGILFPFHILSYVDGKPRDVLTFSSVVVNQPVASTDFDVPTAVTQ